MKANPCNYVLAVRTGNWSDPTTWSNERIPGREDTAVANGNTVFVDTEVHVFGVTNAPVVGARAGGTFVIPKKAWWKFWKKSPKLSCSVVRGSVLPIILTDK